MFVNGSYDTMVESRKIVIKISVGGFHNLAIVSANRTCSHEVANIKKDEQTVLKAMSELERIKRDKTTASDQVKRELDKQTETWQIILAETKDRIRFRCRPDQLYAWGLNYNGQLGLGLSDVSVPTPALLTSMQRRNVSQISAGYSHSVAAAECWGIGFVIKGDYYSCDCEYGYKNGACNQQCNGGAETPCNLHGTFDWRNRIKDEERDARYDCEVDGTCTCERGYQGKDCEIVCEPTKERHYKTSSFERLVKTDEWGTRHYRKELTCECDVNWYGELCDEHDDSSIAVYTSPPRIMRVGDPGWGEFDASRQTLPALWTIGLGLSIAILR